MKVKTTMNKGALRQLSAAQAKAVTMTAIQMLSETRNDAVMPFDTGNLQNESTYVDHSKATQGEVTIVTDTPYARRLYYHPEFNFNKSKNANAGGEWWQQFISGSKHKRPQQWFKEFYRRLTGGLLK